VPGGPWDAQAHIVKTLTDMRDEIVFARRGMQANLASHPDLTSLREKSDAIEGKIIELQREAAKPTPVEFVVQKAPSVPSQPKR
jgi:hypothetical protein